MEWMVLQTLCAAAMAAVGAAIARGWPEGWKRRGGESKGWAAPEDDGFASDLAAMLGYTGEEEQDEA